MDFYSFYRGQEFSAYEYLGAHMEGDNTVFRTFAPAAARISVIGEFSGWEELPMKKVYDGNFWECTVSGAKAGQMYKYRIYTNGGSFTDHADPYAFYAELRPGSASRLYDLTRYDFKDAAWFRQRKSADNEPMNIYELQSGAWQVPDPSHPDIKYSYRELANLLVPYLKKMHCNYLELMPVTEYPSDESWGYQTTGFFAPTARYGSPDELRYLIDSCHQEGIGVILDFVAAHFASDFWALARYDGTALYEYPHSDVGRSEWGSCNFMHSRGEVCSFLESSVHFWLKEYHFDGVRIDAVRNLIYWQGDEKRGVNQSAIKFLRTMNTGIRNLVPHALLIAEDSSSYPGVTKPVSEGGLGFDYKWDLGWMNDTLKFMQTRPYDRKYDYHKLTFSIFYYYNEKYLLPLSHDEVVHGKATIVQKMYGSELNLKFDQARVFYAYMFAHPGKKLNFMGNEIGGLWEWTEKKDLDWWLLKDSDEHRKFNLYMKELMRIYDSCPALYELDYEREGFEWTDCQSEGKYAAYSFVRRSKEQTILAVFNFDETDIAEYKVKLPVQDVPEDGKMEMILCSCEARFGGQLTDSGNSGFYASLPEGGSTVPDGQLPDTGHSREIPVKDGEAMLYLHKFSAGYYLLKG